MEDEDGTEYIESLLIEAEKGEAVLHIAFISYFFKKTIGKVQ